MKKLTSIRERVRIQQFLFKKCSYFEYIYRKNSRHPVYVVMDYNNKHNENWNRPPTKSEIDIFELQGYICVETKFTDTMTNEEILELSSWLEDNMTGLWRSKHLSLFQFKSEDDAALFKLKWW